MTPKAATRAEADRLFAAFQAAGAIPVDADILLPAETLLDLYGEDIRAKAYVTTDPVLGEMMLRPDFTVPVVQAHMAHGADPARYCYRGEVFRAQDHLGAPARESLQVGFEVFDRQSPERADAEVFALFGSLLSGLNVRAVTGDIGILMAAVRGISASDKRKAAPHNVIAGTAAELGILGALALLAVLLSVLWAIRHRRPDADRPTHIILAALLHLLVVTASFFLTLC